MTDANEIPPPPRASAVPVDAPKTEPAQPFTERPPTASAVAAAFLGLEEKMLGQLSANHVEQMRATRDGQNAMLRSFHETVVAATSKLDALVVRFESEFARSIRELQETTHDHKNLLTSHTLQLKTHDDAFKAQAKTNEYFGRLLTEIETWKTQKIQQEHPEPPPDKPGQSS